MTTLYLVGHFLPQPYAVESVTSQARALGRNHARDVLAFIAESFDNDASASLGNTPFGIDEVAPLLPALSPASLMAMSFLENATALFDEITPSYDGDADEAAQHMDMLPPHAPRRHTTVAAPNIDTGSDKSRTRAGPTTQVGGATSSTAPSTTAPSRPSTTTPTIHTSTGRDGNASTDATEDAVMHEEGQGSSSSTTTSLTFRMEGLPTTSAVATPTVTTTHRDELRVGQGHFSDVSGIAEGLSTNPSPKKKAKKKNSTPPVDKSKSIKQYLFPN